MKQINYYLYNDSVNNKLKSFFNVLFFHINKLRLKNIQNYIFYTFKSVLKYSIDLIYFGNNYCLTDVKLVQILSKHLVQTSVIITY